MWRGQQRLDKTILSFIREEHIQMMAIMTYIREYFARVKVFVDIFIGKTKQD